MKKATIILILLTMSVVANAQEKGDMAVGSYLIVGSGGGYTNGGIGAKFLYNASNRIRLAAEFDAFLKDYYKNLYNINVYAHLLPRNRDRIVVFYPFVGVGRESKVPPFYMTIDNVTHKIVLNNTALLYGVGIDTKLSTKLILNSELRCHQTHFGLIERGPSLIYGGSLNLAVGLLYKF